MKNEDAHKLSVHQGQMKTLSAMVHERIPMLIRQKDYRRAKAAAEYAITEFQDLAKLRPAWKSATDDMIRKAKALLTEILKTDKKGNDMTNNLQAKKLAVIKSNAAPEVKLKALEKLNATLTLKRGGGDELLELSPEAQKAIKERFKTAQPSSDKMALIEAVKRMFKQGKKLSEIEKALKIKIDYDGVTPGKDIPAGQFAIK